MVWGILFHPQSPQTRVMASLLADVLFLSAAVFLIVAGLVAFSVLRYRAAAGAGAEGAKEAARTPRQHFGSHRIEALWTAVPVLVLAALFVLTARAITLIDAPLHPDQPPDLVVTGHQWWWEARYPNGAVTSSEIHIPAWQAIAGAHQSADVIHDFWVPQLARKMDAVPGRGGYIWLEANEPGRYQGMCSEFCGAQHAWMRFVGDRRA